MTDAARYTEAYLTASRAALDAFIADAPARAAMLGMAEDIAASMQAGGKYLTCGNGGSAADAQHIAGEFISRLMFDHAPLPSVALTTDTSAMTATGNDYGYEHIFSRQVIGLGRRGDVLLAISTSGNSPNVLAAIHAAKAQGMIVHGFTGGSGGQMASLCDRIVLAPSPWTPVIQQIHITAAHIVCALVERAMFPDQAPPI